MKLEERSPEMKLGDRVTIPGSGKDSFGVITELLEKRCMHNDYYVVTTDSGKVVTLKRQDEVNRMPVVGMGVSYGCWTDVYPGTIVEVSKSGRQITTREDKYKYAGKPGQGGPGGMDSNNWDYYSNDNGRVMVFKLNKHGRWAFRGYRAHVGGRRYYHDYSF